MNILYATAEAAPFIKTGGLADVAGSLPLNIKKQGHDIRVVLPLHGKISDEYKKDMKKIGEYYVDLNWRRQYVGIMELKFKNIIFYFLDNEYYFKRDNIYGEIDDGERYAYFSKAVALFPKEINFKPDIIHSNDWHTGLVSLFVNEFKKGDSYYNDIKTVFTIHNLKYQGIFPHSILGQLMGLSDIYFREDEMKFYDSVNYMKAGIVYSNIITTVSKSYSEEIKYDFFGEGLEGVLNKYSSKLRGIINGIDYEVYNPKSDICIEYNYDLKNLKDKYKNKRALQKLLSLPQKKDTPIIAMVTRLVDMKGLDLVEHILEELLQEDIQLVILGTGDRRYEELFTHYRCKYPDKVSSNIYFSEEKAHKIYAGSDIFLMPSMIEPCGLSQLIALRYGTLPIVREVGGLKDTVIAYNMNTGKGNGFSFKNYNAHEMLFKIRDAIKIYKEDKETWNALVENAMNSNNSWEQSSNEYIKIYKELLDH